MSPMPEAPKQMGVTLRSVRPRGALSIILSAIETSLSVRRIPKTIAPRGQGAAPPAMKGVVERLKTARFHLRRDETLAENELKGRPNHARSQDFCRRRDIFDLRRPGLSPIAEIRRSSG